MLQSIAIAVQFLTRLPTPRVTAISDRDIGRSMLFYPLVGLAIGLLLAAILLMMNKAPQLIQAALLLAAWVYITGGLHLDGLADSADAWVGGMGDRERTLAIMKDPNCGPAGVTAIAMVLIVKFAALCAAAAVQDWRTLVLAPLAARALLPLLFLTTPYVRPGGLGATLARHLPRRAAMGMLAVTATGIVVLTGWAGARLLLWALAVFLGLRTLMTKRIGGTTGDTAGALVEIAEATMLVTAPFI